MVALAGQEVAGYLTASAYEADWAVSGVREGWVSQLGVRRAWRGRGLARRLLAASTAAIPEDDLRSVALSVDSGNPSGALKLYTGLGFVQQYRQTHWSGPL